MQKPDFSIQATRENLEYFVMGYTHGNVVSSRLYKSQEEIAIEEDSYVPEGPMTVTVFETEADVEPRVGADGEVRQRPWEIEFYRNESEGLMDGIVDKLSGKIFVPGTEYHASARFGTSEKGVFHSSETEIKGVSSLSPEQLEEIDKDGLESFLEE